MSDSNFIDIGNLHILKDKVQSVQPHTTDYSNMGGNISFSIIVKLKDGKSQSADFKSESEMQKEFERVKTLL